MLTSAFRVLVKNLVKESFYRKKKTINVLTTFFILNFGYYIKKGNANRYP